jgi:hypothetical protein
LRDGRPAQVPVSTGLDDDTHAEILIGDLKEGDQIIVNERHDNGKSATLPRPRF